MTAPTISTGYADNLGNVFIYGDGYTTIDGVVVRGTLAPGQRRMLQPGESYYDTRGNLRTVPPLDSPDS